MRALYAYFMHGVQPVDTSPPPTQLPFPFNIRLSMAVWNMLFLDSTPFRPDPDRDAVWNRGAYLARGLTHRSEEHTSELQSLMRISYAVFCLKNKTTTQN